MCILYYSSNWYYYIIYMSLYKYNIDGQAYLQNINSRDEVQIMIQDIIVICIIFKIYKIITRFVHYTRDIQDFSSNHCYKIDTFNTCCFRIICTCIRNNDCEAAWFVEVNSNCLCISFWHVLNRTTLWESTTNIAEKLYYFLPNHCAVLYNNSGYIAILKTLTTSYEKYSMAMILVMLFLGPSSTIVPQVIYHILNNLAHDVLYSDFLFFICVVFSNVGKFVAADCIMSTFQFWCQITFKIGKCRMNPWKL